ncbi:MAG TPA: nucleotidyltransferase, partial [Bacteroidia bacterium]|nr:nucleotidyltransferase [Bacteroidia bacterium]
MTKSYILSGKKLPEQLVEILNALGKIFASRRIEFFIIGATARDILMEHLHKAGIRKATLDIDLAVYVPNWNAYDSLIEEILSTENFSQGNIPHRIVYKENYEVDIIPFGDLERDGAIHWPPDETKAMTVLGFVETYHNAIDLTIEETNESFKVVSIPGLMI